MKNRKLNVGYGNQYWQLVKATTVGRQESLPKKLRKFDLSKAIRPKLQPPKFDLAVLEFELSLEGGK